MKVTVNGIEAELEVEDQFQIIEDRDRVMVKGPEGSFPALAVRKGDVTFVSFQGRTYEVKKVSASRGAAAGAGSGQALAPMPGQIVEVSVSPDQKVEKGDKLVVLEAMKMQLPVVADVPGTVNEVLVAVGDQVSDGQILVSVEPSE